MENLLERRSGRKTNPVREKVSYYSVNYYSCYLGKSCSIFMYQNMIDLFVRKKKFIKIRIFFTYSLFLNDLESQKKT